MTRHLLRLIWNRKRQNFLLTLEIFFSFLTLFGVVLFAMQYANNSRQPLGYRDRSGLEHRASIARSRTEDAAVKARHRETYRQLLIALREMPQVEGVGGRVHRPVRQLELGRRHAAGRRAQRRARREPRHRRLPRAVPACRSWPDAGSRREDDAATWTPVVINRRLAQEIFGDENPIGQIIKEERDPNDPPPDPNDKPRGQARHRRHRGVPPERRARRRPRTIMFYRMRLDDADPEGRRCPDRLFVRLAPGHAGGVRGDAREAGHGGRRGLVVRSAAARRDARGQAARSTPFRSWSSATIAGVPAADGGARA